MDVNPSNGMARRLSRYSTKIIGVSTADLTEMFGDGKHKLRTGKIGLPDGWGDEEDLITQAYLGYYENQKKEIVESWLSSHLTNKSNLPIFDFHHSMRFQEILNFFLQTRLFDQKFQKGLLLF